MGRNYKDLSGMKVGKWLVVKIGSSKTNCGGYKWVCQCECGSIKEIPSGNLLSGQSKGCGHCGRLVTKKHGMSTTREYAAWTNMINRCNNPRFPGYCRYGAKGISVCDRWNSFELFFSDMGKKPFSGASLDRIDNSKGYGPDNCRWVSMKIQERNRTNNLMIEIHGVTKCLSEWVEFYQLDYGKTYAAIKRGASLESIVVSRFSDTD